VADLWLGRSPFGRDLWSPHGLGPWHNRDVPDTIVLRLTPKEATAVQRLRAGLRKRSLSVTPQRIIVLVTFLRMTGPVTIDQVCKAADAKWPRIGRSTTWRTLELLTELRMARRSGTSLFRYRRI